jgi:hypothetical protein
MSNLLIATMLLGPVTVAALLLAYLPRRRGKAPAPTYRETPVEWPAPRLRLHPRFDRLPR